MVYKNINKITLESLSCILWKQCHPQSIGCMCRKFVLGDLKCGENFTHKLTTKIDPPQLWQLGGG